MLCNEVTGTRVQTTSKKTAGDKIYQRFRAEIRNEGIVKDCLSHDVEDVPTRQTLTTNKCRAESIEKYLKRSA